MAPPATMRRGKDCEDAPLYVPDKTGSQWKSMGVTGMKLGKNLFQLCGLACVPWTRTEIHGKTMWSG
jgi:hypothetical protein